MPSVYAHYRFGTQILPSLPADVRRPIQRFRRLYDVGLHGPDLFRYDNPLTRSTMSVLAERYRSQTGREFFTKSCKRLRLSPVEAGFAYLYGALAHYCLESVCAGVLEEAGADRDTVEGEFDRYLLALDGREPPYTWDRSAHLKLTRGECVTVAEFYPPAGGENVHHCIGTMHWWVKHLAVPEGTKRGAMKKFLSFGSPAFRGLILPTRCPRGGEALDEALEEAFRQAQELFPQLLEQITAHITYNAPLGEEFDKRFDGRSSASQDGV